jgi:hypothetical protein
MLSKLVTVANVMNSAEAQFVANRLKEAGIEAAIADDNVVSMDFLFGNAVGWIKVQVREQDIARAKEILDTEPPPVDEAEIPWEQPPEEDDQDADDEATPEERSRKIAERTAPVELDPSAVETEQMVSRAYRMAIIGLFLCPPILNLFSVYLLNKADKNRVNFTELAVRRSYIAFLTNILSIVFFGLGWLTLFLSR